MLSVESVSTFYGELQALWDVSIKVDQGELVAILGSNGAGKTTLMKTITGLLKARRGNIRFLGKDIGPLPVHKRVSLGLCYIPAERELFPHMTVIENLELGAYIPEARREYNKQLEVVMQLFPILKERRKQLAGTLSGGEQQMLAIARGLMSSPRLLMLDEPSSGLAPSIAKTLFKTIEQINSEGLTILLVEQNVSEALKVADRGYVLESGRVVLEDTSGRLMENPRLKEAYLGM